MGGPELLLRWLTDGSLAVTGAVLLVLALRRPLRRAFGARLAYLAWSLVPLALVAALLPRPSPGQGLAAELGALHPGVLVTGQADALVVRAPGAFDGTLLPVLAWLVGVAAAAWLFARQQRRFVAGLGPLARDVDGHWRGAHVPGPAVVGALRPRIVLPADFEARHGADEAALVVEHERTHLERGDTRANLVAVALRCLFWFHPLLHLAARCFRLDQELACDAAVVARHPHARRRYAGAMLNVQLAVPGLPVGCHWQSSQSLKERILMLKRIQPGPGRRKAGLIVIGLLLVTCSYAAWAVRPAPTPAPTVASAPEAPSPPPAAPAPPAVPVPGELPAAPPPPPPPPPAPLAPPRYPAEAAAAGQGGRVVMKLLVGVDGRVRDVVVEHSEPAGVFDAAAVEAARGWTLTPARKGGVPVEGWVRVPVDFQPDAQPVLERGPQALDRTPPPKYPAAALAAGLGGRVVLKVLVGVDGQARDVVVESSEPAGVFDEATVAAVRGWRFAPLLRGGQPVEGWLRVPVDFDPTP